MTIDMIKCHCNKINGEEVTISADEELCDPVREGTIWHGPGYDRRPETYELIDKGNGSDCVEQRLAYERRRKIQWLQEVERQQELQELRNRISQAFEDAAITQETSQAFEI
ncbi:hypothetical protein NHQ30_005297 [Ciborinia camelliae]|nr:hypothetical protein NHQ30_005297 [Ciborinia camelliae]